MEYLVGRQVEIVILRPYTKPSDGAFEVTYKGEVFKVAGHMIGRHKATQTARDQTPFGVKPILFNTMSLTFISIAQI